MAPSYLVKKCDFYYFRHYVPIQIQKLVGNKEFLKTLKVTKKSVAVKISREMKIAFDMAVTSGVNPNSCEHALDYLIRNGTPCFGYYYERDLVTNRPDGTPFHCVYVKGDPVKRQLLGYVEFFGVQKIVVALSSSYKGKAFNNCYAVNPMDGREIQIDVEMDFSSDDIEMIYKYEKIPDGSIVEAYNKVLPTGLAASFDKQKNRVMDDAVKYGFANCGAKKGEMLTAEHIERLLKLIAAKMTPFLLNHLSRKNRVRFPFWE